MGLNKAFTRVGGMILLTLFFFFNLEGESMH